MPRYIDADKVLEKMRNTFDMQDLYLPIHFKELIIDDMPTADVPDIHVGDMISRQAVLDSFKRICDNYCEDKKHGFIMCRSCYLEDAIDIVENLPSAKPEDIKGEEE